VAAGGASASVRVPALVKGADAPATPASEPAGPTTEPAKPSDAPPAALGQAPGLSTQQTLGLVVGGVGLIGAGLGTYFGIRAISRNGDAEKDCNDAQKCRTVEAVNLTNDARQDARFANIAFAAGGVLVATGAVLYLTGGSSNADRVALVPLVGPRLAAASVSGRF
jgi:serine/threonine-protein kinase